MQLADRERRDTDGLVKNLNRVGRVYDIKNDDTGGPVCRIQYNDRQSLVTKWLPAGQRSAGGRRSVENYRVGQEVLVCHLSNSIEDGVVMCGLYTPTNPPPAGTTPGQVVDQFEDGSFIAIDPAGGSYLLDFKGPVTIRTAGAITIEAEGPVIVKSAGQVTVEAPNILLKGDVRIEGDLEVDGNVSNTGDMFTEGVHRDKGGPGLHVP